MLQRQFQLTVLHTALATTLLLAACTQELQEPQQVKGQIPAIVSIEADGVGDTPDVADTELVDSQHGRADLRVRQEQTATTLFGAAVVSPAPSVAHKRFPSPDDGFILPVTPAQQENYAEIDSNAVTQVIQQPVSTFSIDVDTGSYSNVRRFLNGGQLPPADAVRIEELINYFSYAYPRGTEDTPFSISTELGTTPWNSRTRLLHIGLEGYSVDPDDIPAANLVFLLDVSGSMGAPNKLGLLKAAIKMLSRQLDQRDRVSIVVYAGASGVVLEPTAGDDYAAISLALDKLQAGGSTNGQAGIAQAYAMAKEGFIEGGVNRIILATDGDFNVGVSNVDELKKLIERERKSGVALTTLGFGIGNYNDHLMEQLADVGDGAYAYIDTLNEARKVLSEELSATLLTIARDVKIQVEFNPAVVAEYRLLGYENRHLANEDFNNDSVDAGEIGAGHTVTAIYELALHGEGGERHTPLHYGSQRLKSDDVNLAEVARVRLRYKRPDESDSRLIEKIVAKSDMIDEVGSTSANFRFAAAVAAFGQWLRDGKYLQDYEIEQVVALAREAKGDDRFGYRSEFLQLVQLAEGLLAPDQAGAPRQGGGQGGGQGGSQGVNQGGNEG
ncbi:MAG: VWA domain-containing protein [Granulosicoccus sp.]|nr:VWA domain-containing protein [Granulosicoccus sp.]